MSLNPPRETSTHDDIVSASKEKNSKTKLQQTGLYEYCAPVLQRSRPGGK
ncbi:MAG: hypothetical protein RIK87_21125 [Fuerstiella sp.]